MILKKNSWNKQDIDSFQKYLLTMKNTEEKIIWTAKIINTKKPILAISAIKLKEISREIGQGNFLAFLDWNLNTYHENTIINAYLINKIKDFDIQKAYLFEYLKNVDNWASIDSLKLVNKKNEMAYLSLAKELVKNSQIFYRRCGVIILFGLIKDEYLDEIYNIITSLYAEDEYYVNMAVAWLLCELVIKKHDKTINYLKTKQVNDFVLNKTISKCNDSFRICKEDKELLKKMKKYDD